MSVLQDELIAAYKTVKEAMDGFPAASPEERMMLLAAGFRTAWGHAWRRAGKAAQAASTKPSSNLQDLPSAMLGVSPASDTTYTVKEPSRDCASPDGLALFGALAWLRGLLLKRALTLRQYKSLCEQLELKGMPRGTRPHVDDLKRLSEQEALKVLMGE